MRLGGGAAGAAVTAAAGTGGGGGGGGARAATEPRIFAESPRAMAETASVYTLVMTNCGGGAANAWMHATRGRFFEKGTVQLGAITIAACCDACDFATIA
eukprot:6175868-Pleurochrysis_carterae.AAC.1